jgi:Flp pilus assembly protein protease CpaA
MALVLPSIATKLRSSIEHLFKGQTMLNESITRTIGRWFAVAMMLGFGLAMAQSEPTLNQVYEAAQAGRLEQAQVMMQQVLVAHPGSAKAHFVQSELWARQGKLSQARDALASADKLAPGLPFAKPQAVQALRAQLAARSSPVPLHVPAARAQDAGVTTGSASSFPWGLALLLGGAALAIGIFMFRKKPTASFDAPATYANPGNPQGGLSGPQGFGMGNNVGAGAVAQPYGQAPGMGLGGKVMGGLATGLAVGAGVMAAQAIGKSLLGNHDNASRLSDGSANNGFEPLPGNGDLGGDNFGVNDASSWDDGNAVDIGGGGDWDN